MPVAGADTTAAPPGASGRVRGSAQPGAGGTQRSSHRSRLHAVGDHSETFGHLGSEHNLVAGCFFAVPVSLFRCGLSLMVVMMMVAQLVVGFAVAVAGRQQQ